MVSTRGHPSTFPAPDLTPTKSTSPSKVSPSKRITRSSMKEESPSESVALETRPRARSIATTWSHTPSTFTLVWLVVSLPLVIWDIGYMFGRPYTMPGGKWHWPLYSPYELYGRVDLTYGVHAYNTKEGWGPCQTAGNVIETLMYLGYLYIAYAYGQEQNAVGRGAPTNALSFGRRKIVGREAGIAVLLGFSAGLMTFWKTLLYCMLSGSIAKLFLGG